MARYNNFPAIDSPPEPFESALRVAKVRVRPYKSGNVKHAHVVLKKVGEEAYEDSTGRRRTRGIFSLFAHKVINCKPGKEIFFSINGYLEDHVVAFEADLRGSEDADSNTLNSAKSDDTLVQQANSLPPKMRKMWSRRESVAVKKEPVNHGTREMVSIGVQAEPTPSPKPLPVHSQSMITPVPNANGPSYSFSATDWPPFMSSSTVMQTGHVSFQYPSPLDAPTTRTPTTRTRLQSKDDSDRTSTTAVSASTTKVDAVQKGTSRGTSRERSLSPMDLESVSSTPPYSPQLSVAQAPSRDDNGVPWARERDSNTGILVPADSAATLVETTSIRIKDEPLDIALPPSPPIKPKTSSRPFNAPVFVPARLSSSNVITVERCAPSPAPSMSPTDARLLVSSTPTPLTVVKKSVPVAAKTTSESVPSSMEQSSHSQDAREPSPPFPPGLSKTPTANRVVRIDPVFVPSTQTTQTTQPYQTNPRHPLSGSPSPTVTPLDGRGEAKPLTAPTLSGSDSSRKRKRACTGAAEPSEPAVRTDTPLTPSKKWRPIVKQEPQSPVLSTLSLPALATNGFDGVAPLPPSSSGPSISSFSASMYRSEAGSQLKQKRSPDAIIKSEHADYNPLSPDSVSPRPSPTGSLYNTRPFIDLTAPRSHIDRAAYSAPAKRLMKPRRTVAGVASSLPIIRTANIKLDAVSRESAGVRAIVFDPSGERFAVVCRDNSIRVWDNISCIEIAKLAHSSSVISAAWLDGETAIASMGANGVLSKWSCVGKNKWMWDKLVDAGDSEPSCFTYYRHRIAVATVRIGVRIWEDKNGRWLPIGRDVQRRDILSIKFVNNGADLLCACSDGNLISYSISTGRVHPVTKFKTKVFYVDADDTNSHALTAQALGSAHLVDISSPDRRVFGRIIQDYSLREAEKRYGARGIHAFKPILTDYGDAVVFGSVDGRVLVWDRRRGQVVHEMDHGSDTLVQAVASFEGESDQHLVSCTKHGLLTWWRLPIRIF